MPPLRNTVAGVSALHLLPRLAKTLLLRGPHSLKQGDHAPAVTAVQLLVV